MHENSPNPTETANRVIRQGRALVRAVESLSTIEPTGLIERVMIKILIAAYKHRLQAIIPLVPAWVGKKIPSASEHISDGRPMLWPNWN